MAEFEKNLPRRVMDPPLDMPDWSESQYVRWASVKVADDRALIFDVPGGAIDALLDSEAVSDLLNAEYRAIFLHPRARPSLTAHFGWPAIALLDKQGCVYAHGQPGSEDELVALLEKGLDVRDNGEVSPLPMRRSDVPEAPATGGVWTVDEPGKAGLFVQPDRGAPAVVVDGRPYVYGNRADAELVDRPAARAFLDSLPEDAAYLVSEGPLMNCPLPTPEPPKPPPAEDGEEDEAEEEQSG